MFQEVFDYFNALISMPFAEIAILVVIAILVYILAYVVKRVAFIIYNRSTNEVVVTLLTKFIYHLDEFADSMSNAEKRDLAIDKLQSITSYKFIRIPRFILGYIVDMQVAEIRKLQAASEKDADLHK